MVLCLKGAEKIEPVLEVEEEKELSESVPKTQDVHHRK